MTTKSRPPARPCTPYPSGHSTHVALNVDDVSVLVISRRLHDEKCLLRDQCTRRDHHSLESFETPVRKALGALVEAHIAKEI